MKVSFTSDDSLVENEIAVNISAREMNANVTQLIEQIQAFTKKPTTLPITVDERVMLVPIDEIVAIEVYGTEITVQTTTASYLTRGQLKKISLRLPTLEFIQVNKSTIINTEHLDYLEAGFSGNMTAFLTNNKRVSVSRKYLPELKQVLGL